MPQHFDHYGAPSDCPEAHENSRFDAEQREAFGHGGEGMELMQPPIPAEDQQHLKTGET